MRSFGRKDDNDIVLNKWNNNIEGDEKFVRMDLIKRVQFL